MLPYMFRRVAVAIPTLLILIIASYVLMYAAPGGPFDAERALPPEIMANLEHKYGLDQPLAVQIWRYVVSIVTRFDFGPSFHYKDQSVNEIIRQGFPGHTDIWCLVLRRGCPGGRNLGRRGSCFSQLPARLPGRGRLDRRTGSAELRHGTASDVGLHTLAWLVAGGGWQGGHWPYVIMPVIALSTSFMASIARLTRTSMLEILNADFIRAARAKGLPRRRIVFRHALKPTMLPVISYLGPAFVGLRGPW